VFSNIQLRKAVKFNISQLLLLKRYISIIFYPFEKPINQYPAYALTGDDSTRFEIHYFEKTLIRYTTKTNQNQHPHAYAANTAMMAKQRTTQIL